MGKQITITIGNEQGTAELLTELAPQLCETIERHLPLTGLLTHAKLVDREVFFQAPFFYDQAENNKFSEKGDLGFWNGRQSLCFFYDDMTPLGNIPTFARVTENLAGLQREAAQVWACPKTRITITRKEG